MNVPEYQIHRFNADTLLRDWFAGTIEPVEYEWSVNRADATEFPSRLEASGGVDKLRKHKDWKPAHLMQPVPVPQPPSYEPPIEPVRTRAPYRRHHVEPDECFDILEKEGLA